MTINNKKFKLMIFLVLALVVLGIALLLIKKQNIQPNLDILSSTNDCILSKDLICPNGTEVTVEVNDDTSYNFYVIADTGSELTLIMDRNIKDEIKWNDISSMDNSKGPLTSLKELESLTADWINVPVFSYKLTDDSDTPLYKSITRTKVRSRMLTYTEAAELGCKSEAYSCPVYLIKNLSEDVYGYWLSTTYKSDNHKWFINYSAAFGHYDDAPNGIRAVITVSKYIEK